MKVLTILFIVFCSNSAFSQLSVSSPKSIDEIKSDSIHSYLYNGISTSQNGELIDNSPIYLKYVAQTKTTDSLAFMLDSTLVDQSYIYCLDPNEIDDINIFRNTQFPKGVMYIKLKNHVLLSKILNSKLLSFSDITYTYLPIDDSHKPVIYLLDKQLVTDTTKRRIPEICLEHVMVAKASDMPYFKTAMPDVLIVMITTKPVSTKPKHPNILIRGTASN